MKKTQNKREIIFKNYSKKKPQDQGQQARKYTMKLKPQSSENKEVILYEQAQTKNQKHENKEKRTHQLKKTNSKNTHIYT